MTGKMDTGFFARLWLASLCARVCVFIVSLSLYYRLTGNMRVRVCVGWTVCQKKFHAICTFHISRSNKDIFRFLVNIAG